MQVASYSQTRLALGCDTTLVLVGDLAPREIELLFARLWLQIFNFEKQFSRFLPNSELSKFNKQAGLRVPISEAFENILLAAQSMAQKTDGLFNPFILPALQQTGYMGSAVEKHQSDTVDDYSKRSVANFNQLLVEKGFATMPSSSAIDLGGCGKGYLADQLTKLPDLSQLHGYWFSLGGDIVGKGTDETGRPWEVSVQDGFRPDNMIETTLQFGESPFAVATSGVIERRGKNYHGSWHHIINPATLKPADTDIQLVTVQAKNCLESDVLASCAVILGSVAAPTFLKQHGAKSAVIQYKSNSEHHITQFGSAIKTIQETTV